MEATTLTRKNEKTINLSLNKRQFVEVFRFMDEEDRIDIYKELQKILYLNRFERLLQSVRTDELSYEDITKEVEFVRQKRYETGKQIRANNH